MERNPIAAGKFYPGTAASLHAEIERLTDSHVPRVRVIGLVAPHAGYLYSGVVAGATYSRVEFKDTFVILGPSHSGRGTPFSIMTEGTWKTPLGEVQIDSGLGEQILHRSEYLRRDTAAHLHEHSIEVQVPFLQYFKNDVKIVPIVLSPAWVDVYREIGRDIARAIKELEKEAVIVASSDMTHYEPYEAAMKKDTYAIEAILDLDEDELMRRIEELNITMCGCAPVVSLICAAKELGAQEAELECYRTSGDTSGDYRRVVGYAGIIIK